MTARLRGLRALGLAVCAATLAVAALATEPVEVQLTVTQEAAGPRIEPTVYGQFAEHLGTGIYGCLLYTSPSPRD